MIQPDWKVLHETMDEGLAALSWSLRDEADQLWFGVLLITPTEAGVWVRLWMGGWCGNPDICFPGGPRGSGAGSHQSKLTRQASEAMLWGSSPTINRLDMASVYSEAISVVMP